jgi:hypothetical protein
MFLKTTNGLFDSGIEMTDAKRKKRKEFFHSRVLVAELFPLSVTYIFFLPSLLASVTDGKGQQFFFLVDIDIKHFQNIFLRSEHFHFTIFV